MQNNVKTVAIIGAGKLGIVLAQLALQAGYTVYVSGSGSPDKIRLSIDVLAAGAIATTTPEAVKHADIVVLALPLSKYRSIPSDTLKDKLVIDSMNYWWEVDGEMSDSASSTSEMVQAYFSSARVVKALSHMGYHHLHDEAKLNDASHRKAIAIAGNDDSDNNVVAKFVDSLGFDPLLIGKLSKGIYLEPGHAAFGANVSRSELTELV